MILTPLTRHLAVCSLGEVQRFLSLDRGFWHVISVRDTSRTRLALPDAREVLPLFFDDVEVDGAMPGSRGMTESQAAAVWSFVERNKEAALLMHCVAGLSRSTAIAAAIIARSLIEHGVPLDAVPTETVDRLLTIRPPACPNCLVLRCLLEQFMDASQARQITDGIRDDDRIIHNRFVRPL